MHELGLVARLPRISVIQAAGANPLVRSLAENHGTALEPVEAHTRAPPFASEIQLRGAKLHASFRTQEAGASTLPRPRLPLPKLKSAPRAWLRACFRRFSRRPQEAPRSGRHRFRRNRGSGPYGPHPQRRRLYHRLPSRTLLRDEESAGVEQEIAALRRDAVTVDATPAAVLAAMKDRTA